MNRRPPSRVSIGLAAGMVVVALAALIVLPLLLNRRIERHRSEIDQHVDPARIALKEINYSLGQQMAALIRGAARRDPRSVSDYREAVPLQEEAMRSLKVHVGSVLGAEFDRRFVELEQRMEQWNVAVEQGVDMNELAFDENYLAVIEGVHLTEDAITDFQSERRRQLQRIFRIQAWVTGGLVLLAGVAAILVLWMVARLRTLASDLSDEAEAREEALERERELVRFRDEILGVVSHDLRSPLTTIALSTQLIPGSSAEEQDEHLQTIVTTTRRMERLIQDLLDVTRIDHGKLTIRRDLIDPVAIAREVIASHVPIAGSKGIALETSIEDPLPTICGDGDRLAQALGNLLGNAFKFTPAGGKVRLDVQRMDGKVLFEITDSGPGIAQSELPRLFEPFWQGKKTAHLGAGLGLKITRAIVQAHDGTIDAGNAPEGGARFTFEIPAETGPDGHSNQRTR